MKSVKNNDFMKEKFIKYFTNKYDSKQVNEIIIFAMSLFSMLANDEIENARKLSFKKLKEEGVDVS